LFLHAWIEGKTEPSPAGPHGLTRQTTGTASRPFRLGIAQALALMLAAQVAIAVAAMAIVMALSLSHGFSAYLRARDAQMLDAFAGVCERVLAEQGDALVLRPGGMDMRLFLDRLAVQEGIDPGPPPGRPPPPHPPPPGFGPPPGFAPPEGLPPDPGRPPAAGFGRPPPPPEAADSFGPRISLTLPDGTWLAGLHADRAPGALTRALHVNGKLAAIAVLAPAPAPAGVDAAFLRGQYQRIAVAAALLLAAAITAGARLAGLWSRPLRAIRQATAQIAGGDFSVRLAEAGALEMAMTISNINDMAEALQRLEQTRRGWLAQISHELRTPLTVLRGELEALTDGVRPLGPAAIASLREEAVALSALVDDLHLLAISDLGRLPCHFSAVDPAVLLHRAAERFAHAAAGRGLVLSCDAAANATPAHWDANRIDQVLANLLANSLRYTDAPGRIRLLLVEAPTHVTLIVEDSPPGVPANQLSQLMQPFYRVDAARSRAQGGSGLGLAVCAAIATAHGGTLTLAASPLGGLQASLRLPRTPLAS